MKKIIILLLIPIIFCILFSSILFLSSGILSSCEHNMDDEPVDIIASIDYKQFRFDGIISKIPNEYIDLSNIEHEPVERFITTYDELNILINNYLGKNTDNYILKQQFEDMVALLVFREFDGSSREFYFDDFKFKEDKCNIIIYNKKANGHTEDVVCSLQIIFIPKSDFPEDFDYSKEYEWNYSVRIYNIANLPN